MTGTRVRDVIVSPVKRCQCTHSNAQPPASYAQMKRRKQTAAAEEEAEGDDGGGGGEELHARTLYPNVSSLFNTFLGDHAVMNLCNINTL